MDRFAYYRKAAADYLAIPLVVLSAVLCLFAWVKPPLKAEWGMLPAAGFAVVCRRKAVWQWALAALLVYLLYAAADAVTEPLAAFCGQHPAIFGAVNNIYSLVGGSRLETLVLHTDCTGAVITENGIITGAADMVAAGVPSAAALTARWLNGAYLAAQFLPLGGAAFLWRRCDKRKRLMLLAVTSLSVLTGDCRLFSLVLLLLSPAGYPVYLMLTSLGYLTAALLGSTGMLFALSGAVLAVLFYFTLEWWRNNYGFTQNIIRESRLEI